jgi:hypothetical protein
VLTREHAGAASMEDRTDYENADRGFIDKMDPCVVMGPELPDRYSPDAPSEFAGSGRTPQIRSRHGSAARAEPNIPRRPRVLPFGGFWAVQPGRL